MSEELKRLIIEDEQKEIREIINSLPQPEMTSAESSFTSLPEMTGTDAPKKTENKEDDITVEVLKLGSEIAKIRNELRIIMDAINAIGHGIQNSHRLHNETLERNFREILMKVEGVKRDIGAGK